MLWKDHHREWRDWQLADRDREQWTIDAQLAQAEAESKTHLENLNSDLLKARSTKVDASFIERFKDLVIEEDRRLQIEQPASADFSSLDAAKENMEKADEKSVVAAREDLLDAMNRFILEAKRRENALVTKKKFIAADKTAAVSARGIAVGEGKPLAEIEQRIQTLADQITQLDADIADAEDYRTALEDIVRDVQSGENDIARQIAAIRIELDRLQDNLQQYTSNFGERITRGPILDALYTGNIKLDQIWLPDMKINYNFSQVARYDRCIVCHRAIDKTAAGSATEPAYPAIPHGEREPLVELSTPDAAPEAAEGENASLETVYGIRLAPRGQVDSDAVTIQVVYPESLAAEAGLQTGDIIQQVNGGEIHEADDVDNYLLRQAAWGKPLQLRIRRGLNQPFTSHPRLDLFVGSMSPHKKGEMGCTICHDGQGSATEFKWASHTPNDPKQAKQWSREHGWFDNHHWIFPMTPERFIESNCLKCHHEVVDLEPSERFPDPPAPKLVQGYQLVREYGCYGCHEINGYDGPEKRIGPDLRIEPNYSAVASQILTDQGLSDEERAWAVTLHEQPDDKSIRDQLYRAIALDASLKGSSETAEEARLAAATHVLADSLKDIDAPGKFRKVGPSLRHLASKVDFGWLLSWIRQPSDFRPTTRMPQFFGHFDHLDNQASDFVIVDANGNEEKLTDREYTERFEAVETRALAGFLLKNSQPFETSDKPAGVTEMASVERGRWLFESRGCLACHTHGEFREMVNSNQGPDLSRVAAKFNTPNGRDWLYSWLKQPSRYHARTAMPNLYLDPITELDAAGNPTGKVTDPADDIVAFLLGVPADWQPPEVPPFTPKEQAALHQLTTVWLSASFPRRRAERFAREGIPEQLAATVKTDEIPLVGMTPENRVERQMEYVARRSLSRYGCFGCHDIPGYESAKPIGTPLANWGRKDLSQLAFENVGAFLATHGINGDEKPAEHGEQGGSNAHGLDPDRVDDPDTGYFVQSLNSHQRHGFLWQKLRMPRGFDFETTRNKRYDERLRMPKFPFTPEEREAVMTFVLGLTSEAPDQRYVYKPDARQEAIVQGRHVLNKYNCGGCHILDMERWDIAFEPDMFEDPPAPSDYPFLAPVGMEKQIEASLQPDRRGLLHAELHGMPTRNPETGDVNLVDEDGVPLEPDDDESDPYYEFQLYKHAVVSGATRLVGVQNLLIPANRDHTGPANGTAYPLNGGDLAKYLFPNVIAEEHKSNPAANPSEAWAWLPPPLMTEGEKVQTDWLHDFLMDPSPIRPAVVMRMPNFHMSSDEASKLVNYFAAKSNATFPYEYNERRRGQYLVHSEQAHPNLFDDGMKVVTDGNYCVKCHSVGDFQVKGAIRGLGPNLDEVYRRLRPEYVHRWVANPQRILPYTGMPVNIPYDPNPPHFGGISQQLFPGASTAQLNGLVDLLMNFDEYAKRRTSVKSLVKEPPATTEKPPAAEAAETTEPRDDQSVRR
jgi:mono/diheme cytochrome c family protein